jgi:DegV family protein with EDD domain
MTVCVVTDSSAVMPASWLQTLPLRIVPLEVAWADGGLSRGDAPYQEIAARLRDAPVPPKTGAPSPGLYEELVGELLATNDGVLIVCPSADLSTTYASAKLGASQVNDERVRVLDSKTAAAGQGMVAAQAARAAAQGADVDGATQRALDVAAGMHIWATLAQLEFLRRSGRLPAIAAMGADALRLQPIVRYAGSSPSPVGVVRSPQRATQRLYDAWERSIAAAAELSAVAFHSARIHDAQALRDRIVERVPTADANVVEVTASLAAHTGPGLLGLAWFWDSVRS